MKQKFAQTPPETSILPTKPPPCQTETKEVSRQNGMTAKEKKLDELLFKLDKVLDDCSRVLDSISALMFSKEDQESVTSMKETLSETKYSIIQSAQNETLLPQAAEINRPNTATKDANASAYATSSIHLVEQQLPQVLFSQLNTEAQYMIDSKSSPKTISLPQKSKSIAQITFPDVKNSNKQIFTDENIVLARKTRSLSQKLNKWQLLPQQSTSDQQKFVYKSNKLPSTRSLVQPSPTSLSLSPQEAEKKVANFEQQNYSDSNSKWKALEEIEKRRSWHEAHRGSTSVEATSSTKESLFENNNELEATFLSMNQKLQQPQIHFKILYNDSVTFEENYVDIEREIQSLQQTERYLEHRTLAKQSSSHLSVDSGAESFEENEKELRATLMCMGHNLLTSKSSSIVEDHWQTIYQNENSLEFGVENYVDIERELQTIAQAEKKLANIAATRQSLSSVDTASDLDNFVNSDNELTATLLGISRNLQDPENKITVNQKQTNYENEYDYVDIEHELQLMELEQRKVLEGVKSSPINAVSTIAVQDVKNSGAAQENLQIDLNFIKQECERLLHQVEDVFVKKQLIMIANSQAEITKSTPLLTQLNKQQTEMVNSNYRKSQNLQRISVTQLLPHQLPLLTTGNKKFQGVDKNRSKSMSEIMSWRQRKNEHAPYTHSVTSKLDNKRIIFATKSNNFVDTSKSSTQKLAQQLSTTLKVNSDQNTPPVITTAQLVKHLSLIRNLIPIKKHQLISESTPLLPKYNKPLMATKKVSLTMDISSIYQQIFQLLSSIQMKTAQQTLHAIKSQTHELAKQSSTTLQVENFRTTSDKIKSKTSTKTAPFFGHLVKQLSVSHSTPLLAKNNKKQSMTSKQKNISITMTESTAQQRLLIQLLSSLKIGNNLQETTQMASSITQQVKHSLISQTIPLFEINGVEPSAPIKDNTSPTSIRFLAQLNKKPSFTQQLTDQLSLACQVHSALQISNANELPTQQQQFEQQSSTLQLSSVQQKPNAIKPSATQLTKQISSMLQVNCSRQTTNANKTLLTKQLADQALPGLPNINAWKRSIATKSSTHELAERSSTLCVSRSWERLNVTKSLTQLAQLASTLQPNSTQELSSVKKQVTPILLSRRAEQTLNAIKLSVQQLAKQRSLSLLEDDAQKTTKLRKLLTQQLFTQTLLTQKLSKRKSSLNQLVKQPSTIQVSSAHKTSNSIKLSTQQLAKKLSLKLHIDNTQNTASKIPQNTSIKSAFFDSKNTPNKTISLIKQIIPTKTAFLIRKLVQQPSISQSTPLISKSTKQQSKSVSNSRISIQLNKKLPLTQLTNQSSSSSSDSIPKTLKTSKSSGQPPSIPPPTAQKLSKQVPSAKERAKQRLTTMQVKNAIKSSTRQLAKQQSLTSHTDQAHKTSSEISSKEPIKTTSFLRKNTLNKTVSLMKQILPSKTPTTTKQSVKQSLISQSKAICHQFAKRNKQSIANAKPEALQRMDTSSTQQLAEQPSSTQQLAEQSSSTSRVDRAQQLPIAIKLTTHQLAKRPSTALQIDAKKNTIR